MSEKVRVERKNRPDWWFEWHTPRRVDGINLPSGFYYHGRKHTYMLIIDTGQYCVDNFCEPNIWIALLWPDGREYVAVTIEREIKATAVHLSKGVFHFR